MSYGNYNNSGNLHPEARYSNNSFDSINQVPQNPFESPYMTPRRSLSPESPPGDGSEGSRHYSDASRYSTSRPESYGFPQVPLQTRQTPAGLGRASGHRTLSDLYDESPPRTPVSSQPPRRPWLSASRPESEATLMGSTTPTPYSVSPSPYVRVQFLLVDTHVY